MEMLVLFHWFSVGGCGFEPFSISWPSRRAWGPPISEDEPTLTSSDPPPPPIIYCPKRKTRCQLLQECSAQIEPARWLLKPGLSLVTCARWMGSPLAAAGKQSGSYMVNGHWEEWMIPPVDSSGLVWCWPALCRWDLGHFRSPESNG